MSYDEKCFELAGEFLEDSSKTLKIYSQYHKWLYEHTDILAQNIQDTIEEYIQELRDKKEIP